MFLYNSLDDTFLFFVYAAPPSLQHVFLMLLPRLATSSPAPSPKGNASTTEVHWMARMARAEALREGSAVPLLSLPQVSAESPAFASFHIGNPRFGLGFPVLLVSCSFPMLLPSIL